MPEQLPDVNAELLIYCRSGRRSSDAAHKLVALGYTGVYDFGGIIDWPYDTREITARERDGRMTGEFAVAVHALVYLHRRAEALDSEALARNVCTNPARACAR